MKEKRFNELQSPFGLKMSDNAEDERHEIRVSTSSFNKVLQETILSLPNLILSFAIFP
jgi:hypothetical protein